jgi:mannose-6-phosphate isomerase-like protein (cupin superfamily)
MKKVLKKWGWYKVLAKGNGFKVKLLYLEPFGRTSLQRHKHRSEIWIFLDSQKVKTAQRHQWHHLDNPGNKGLRLIEVQIGICQERDIERQKELAGNKHYGQ